VFFSSVNKPAFSIGKKILLILPAFEDSVSGWGRAKKLKIKKKKD
jgi:hypothetical protein